MYVSVVFIFLESRDVIGEGCLSLAKILILGGGYGGMMTAVTLQKKLNYNEADVTLVNENSYHYFTTELHMPAAGTLHHDRVRVPISSLIDENKIKFVQGRVTAIHLQKKQVELQDGTTLAYDYLVIALGSAPETFGIPGLLEYSYGIRDINSVRLIRQHIEYMFAKYTMEPERQEYLTFVVGGAGFTGIEFVGELAERLPKLCREYDVDPQLVKLYNIEAAPSALPGFDPELVEYAMERLEQKGVTFLINTPIKECTPDGVILADDRKILAGTVVWTGGVRGNKLVEDSGIETMRGRVKVDEYLRAPGHDNVFVIGDSSLIFNEEDNRPYPPTAQMATQQGQQLAENLVALLRNGNMKKFAYTWRGTIASLGKSDAIGVLKKGKLKGGSAMFMKKVVDNRYLFMVGGLGLLLRKGKL